MYTQTATTASGEPIMRGEKNYKEVTRVLYKIRHFPLTFH